MNLDYVNYDASRGWPLREAMERTVDPNTWRNWTRAHERYRAHKVLTEGYPSEIRDSEKENDRLRQQADEAAMLPSRELWAHLINERLDAAASRGSISEQPTPIFAAGWERITALNWDTSTVRETVPPHTNLYNVRIYPRVHSADVAKRLVGSSFARAFRRYVLEDPEVMARGKEVMEKHGHESVFREGQMPGFSVSYRWPLQLTVSSLAHDLAHPGMIILGEPLPKPSEIVVRAATVLVDRWHGLIRTLANGSAIARGTFAQSGEVRLLDPLQWERSNVWIDVRDGDFLEPNSAGKLIVRWSGLSFASPTSLASLSAQGADVTERRARSRPKMEVVENAVREAGIDLKSSQLSLKAIANRIAHRLPDEPRTASQYDALAKMIGRLREAART